MYHSWPCQNNERITWIRKYNSILFWIYEVHETLKLSIFFFLHSTSPISVHCTGQRRRPDLICFEQKSQGLVVGHQPRTMPHHIVKNIFRKQRFSFSSSSSEQAWLFRRGYCYRLRDSSLIIPVVLIVRERDELRLVYKNTIRKLIEDEWVRCFSQVNGQQKRACFINFTPKSALVFVVLRSRIFRTFRLRRDAAAGTAAFLWFFTSSFLLLFRS